MKVRILFVMLCFPLVGFSQVMDSTRLIENASKPGIALQNEGFLKKSLMYVPPAAFIGYGVLSLHNKSLQHIDQSIYAERQEDLPGFSTKADNYLQYSPAAVVGLLSISGMQGKSSFTDKMGLYAISTALVSTSVTFFKRNTNKFRPNQSSYTSFPSGHTSVAFAAAEFLNQEYGGRSPWFGIAGYAAAATTGVLRIYNNAHWFSDVVAGAGFGILSTKAAYFVYPQLKKLLPHGKVSYQILPGYQAGYQGLSLFINIK